MDTYTGRLVTDGNGNLLADEGDRAGEPVAYDEGQFIFIEPGSPSHNERHHQQFVDFEGTNEENAEDNPHHYEVQEDDPHFDADAENKTKLRQLPDKVAAKSSGHTEAYHE